MQNTYQNQAPVSTNNAEVVVLNDSLDVITEAASNWPMPVANTAAVVKNDTSAVSEAKVTLAKPADLQTPKARLQSMETATRNWEANELAASNKRLYSILADAYTYYETMKGDSCKETRAQYAKDLEQFIAERKYVFAPTSHDMIRVVKCVFGTDRRRVSAYSIALREALRQEVAAKDLCTFIEQNGGVEQIRLGGTKPLSAKVRAGKVKDEVVGAELGTIKFDARFVPADADWADKQVVIVATYLPTGDFQANAVIRHDSAVNAALAAYYSQQQAAARAEAKAEREAEEKRAAELKKAEESVNKASKNSKRAKAERDAKNKAHTSTLLEEVLA
jgi:hypothetical protein